jgi:iron complex outermembrane receptor protein
MRDNLNLKFGVAITALVLGMSSTANAQATAQAEDDEAVQETVVILGSRRAARSADDTIAPIDVISADELNQQGDVDLLNILRTSVPSLNVNEQPISDAATLVRPANLRGLPPDSTLVLVNGKRRHRSAVIAFLGGGISDGAQGADLSVIPSIALKQVEVLRDGAASQYGSDAVAGVLNFALRDNDEGLIVEGQWGSTYAGDGDQFRVGANFGLALPFAQGGFLNISAEYGEADATDRSVQRDDALALIAAGNTAVQDISVNTVTDEVVQIWGQPEVRGDFVLFANSAVQLSEQLEVYAFGNYAEREVEGGFFFRNPIDRGGVFSNDGGETLLVGDLTEDGTGDCPTITVTDLVPDPAAFNDVLADPDCFVFNEIFPGGFTPRFGGDLTDYSFVTGARGEIPVANSSLIWDVSFTRGFNEADFFINNTINASLGPQTPTDFDPGTYQQKDTNLNLDLSYGVPNTVFASDINFATGFEWRREEFEIIAGDPESFALGPLSAQGFSSSSNGFGGFNGSNAGVNSQENYAVYFDTEVDVTEQLTVQGAVRYEDFYDSFGDTFNWKVGGRYEISDAISVRGTYSTGFRAPTAGQANVSNVTTAFTGGVLQDQGTLPLNSAAGQLVADFLEDSTGVRPELGPEDSENISVGAGLNFAGVNLTVDYFRINVDDRISISDQQDFVGALTAIGASNGVVIPAGSLPIAALQQLDGAGVLNFGDFAGSEDLVSFGFFTNSFDTRTQGIDVVGSTNYEFYAGGTTTFTGAFNWTDTSVTDNGLDTAAPLGFGRQRQLEENIPQFRGNVAVNHQHDKFYGLARVNVFGEFFECHLDSTNNDPASGCDLPIDGSIQVSVDLEAGYQVTDNFQVSVGARNAFDSDPTTNPFSGIVGAQFPTTAPNGFNGGSYYIRARATF